jgi:hypothetical protein
MMIQNSLQLLEHLGEIEEQIHKIEMQLKKFNLEIDSENLLKILLEQIHPPK